MAGTEFVFKIKGDASGAVDASNQAKAAVGGVKKEVNTLNETVNKVGGLIAGAFAVGQIIEFGKAVMKASAQMQSLQIRMEGIYGSAEAANAQMLQLRNTANKLGLDFKDMSSNFVAFTAAAKSTGMEVAKAERIFANMSKAIAGSGASSEAASRAMTALTQMIGKGTIQAEELKGQLGEALPQAIGWMSKAVGVSTQDLMKMMEQGKLTSDALLKFSEVAANDVAGNIDKMSNSITANTNRLSNAWSNYIASLAERFYGNGGGANVLSDMLEWWTRINQSEEQFLRNERARLLDSSKQSEHVAREVKLLREQGKEEAVIVEELRKKRDAQIDLARGYHMVNGYQMVTTQLSAAEKMEAIKLSNAYSEEIKILKDVKKAKDEANKTKGKPAAKAADKQSDAGFNFLAEISKKYREAQNQPIGPEMSSEFKAKIDREKAFYDEIDKLEAASIQHQKDMEQDAADKKKEIDDNLLQQKKANRQQEAKMAAQGIGYLSNFASSMYAKEQADLQRALENKTISEKQYQDKARALKRKEMILNKAAAISQIAINTATGATSAAAAVATLPLVPFIIGLGAAEAALVAAAPIPYAKGTKAVKGGRKGVDSVHAILMPGERVVPTHTNQTPGYNELLNDIQDHKISPSMAKFIHEFSVGKAGLGGVATGGIAKDDLEEVMTKAISKIPSPTFSIDERGVAVISERAAFRQTQIRTKL